MEQSLDKKALFEFLEEVDAELKEATTVVAVGGTALTLMDAKPSTRDVDFTGPGRDIRRLRAVLKSLDVGIKVDTWFDGQVFQVSLPEDYLERAEVARRFKNLEVRRAHPIDLIVTKIPRYDDRDQQDIWNTIEKFKVRSDEVRKRAALVVYVGNEAVFETNLQHLLRAMGARKM